MRINLILGFFLILGAVYSEGYSQMIKLSEMRGGYDEEGCFLFYGSSKARYKAEAWIFMSNGYEARVKINGKRITLKRFGDEDHIDPNNEVFVNAAYEVVLKTRHLSDEENGELRSGNIIVTNKRTGGSQRFSIYGWTGCE